MATPQEIEAVALAIDGKAFDPTNKHWRFLAARRRHAIKTAEAVIAAYMEASNHNKLLEYVARIAYRKGASGIVNFDTGEHDVQSTISGARKWLAEDAARGVG